jgi:hypothetical protein
VGVTKQPSVVWCGQDILHEVSLLVSTDHVKGSGSKKLLVIPLCHGLAADKTHCCTGASAAIITILLPHHYLGCLATTTIAIGILVTIWSPDTGSTPHLEV